jgi:hypothetical protein
VPFAPALPRVVHPRHQSLGFEVVGKRFAIGNPHSGDIIPPSSRRETRIGTEGQNVGGVLAQRDIPDRAYKCSARLIPPTPVALSASLPTSIEPPPGSPNGLNGVAK